MVCGKVWEKKGEKGVQSNGLVLSSKLRKWMAKSDRERIWEYARKKTGQEKVFVSVTGRKAMS